MSCANNMFFSPNMCENKPRNLLTMEDEKNEQKHRNEEDEVGKYLLKLSNWWRKMPIWWWKIPIWWGGWLWSGKLKFNVGRVKTMMEENEDVDGRKWFMKRERWRCWQWWNEKNEGVDNGDGWEEDER